MAIPYSSSARTVVSHAMAPHSTRQHCRMRPSCPHALACLPLFSHVWHAIVRIQHITGACVFRVIIHTPPHTCPPSTIGPPARWFHPIRPPLFEAPKATPIPRPSKTRPDRAGDTPKHDIRTVRTHRHACTAHTSAHTHAHEHKQTLSFSRHLYFTRYLVNLIKRSD